jgi:hypothetical protein
VQEGRDLALTRIEGFSTTLTIFWSPTLVNHKNIIEIRNTITLQFKEIRTTSKGSVTNVYGLNVLANKFTFLDTFQNMGVALKETP